jgi:hypothetical protein
MRFEAWLTVFDDELRPIEDRRRVGVRVSPTGAGENRFEVLEDVAQEFRAPKRSVIPYWGLVDDGGETIMYWRLPSPALGKFKDIVRITFP